MLTAAFKFDLNNSVLEGLATIGKYDGEKPSLTVATSAGKVLMHCPHEQNSKDGKHSVRFLNINRKITAMTSGALDPALSHDILIIGTQTTLLAYNVEKNSDIFFKGVPDGINKMIFGMLPGIEAPLAIVGGNCSIQGFDATGNELFWTVTGDNVSALTFCDADGDGEAELLVGSDDFNIRIFQQEEVISETSETEKVIHLTAIQKTKYGYGLGNGTVGVYDRSTREWRVKSKNKVTSMGSFDLDSDGVPELLSGWSNGRLDVRSSKNGDLVFRDNFSSAVQSILQSDYRLDGRLNILGVSESGEVRGYLPADTDGATAMMGAKANEKEVHKLMRQKQEMQMQLSGLENNLKRLKKGDIGMGMIPPDTDIKLEDRLSRDTNSLELVISTNNSSIIKSVAVFALDGGVFEGESLMAYPPKPKPTLTVQLKPEKNVECQLQLTILVGARASSKQFHVFHVPYRLAKFALYMPVFSADPAKSDQPLSSVTFRISERQERITQWIGTSFNLTKLHNMDLSNKTLHLGFISVRDQRPLEIIRSPDHGGEMTIRGDDMTTVGELIQDLCHFLGMKELESVADFPAEMKKFEEVLLQVDEYNSIRLKLTAEMADNSNLVKNLVIKAEDSRILGDMALMRKMYTELFTLNNELIGEYTKRSNNHQNLLNALKDVNHMIQKAARLRVGKAKTQVVTACRNAIKSNNIHSLFQIISKGYAPKS